MIASLTGDFFAPQERARIYGYVLSGELVGAGVGFVISGAAASALSWRWAFGVLAVPALVLSVAIWRLLPEPERGAQTRPGRPTRELARRAVAEQEVEPVPERVLDSDPRRLRILRAVGYVLRIPTIRWLIIASTVGYFFFAGMRTFALAYLRGQFGLGQAAATGLLVLFGVGAVIAVLSSGRLADRLLASGRLTVRVVLPGICYLAAAALLLPGLLMASLAVAALTLLLAGAALSAPNPPLDAARLDVVPSGLWGRAEGVRALVRQAAQAVAPLAFGALADAFAGGGVHSGQALSPAATRGLRYAFLITLGALALNGIALLVARRGYPGDVATAVASDRAAGARPRPQDNGVGKDATMRGRCTTAGTPTSRTSPATG
jgi:sugar phosphate permease